MCLATIVSAEGKNTLSWPSCQCTRYGGLPSWPWISMISPCRSTSPWWRPLTVSSSPTTALMAPPCPPVVLISSPLPDPLSLAAVHCGYAFGHRLVKPVFQLPDHRATAVEVLVGDVAEQVPGERPVGVGQPRQRHLGRGRERDDRGPAISGVRAS